jgi:predicted transcriptional regulator
MSEDTKIDNNTETEKIEIAHELQKDGMPAKVAAKLAGLTQRKVSKRQ